MTYEELLTHRWEPLPRNNSIEVYVFLGIPYAEKPVAERRMKAGITSALYVETSSIIAATTADDQISYRSHKGCELPCRMHSGH